jgi:hypothetical protein
MPLPRLQLFELEDLAWFPETIRNLSTDYLHVIETRLRLHKPVLPWLRKVLAESKSCCVVDLCSGGGGPVLALYEAMRADGLADDPSVRFTLTDKFPSLSAFERLAAQHPGGIRYSADPVDATDVPSELVGVRTMFNAFHHFAPREARLVLASAVQAGQPIAIFEIPERSIAVMITFLFTPIFVALAPPFIRPFRWDRLLWTYVVPLVPLTCWWDGLVSAWRAYTAAEMVGLTSGFDGYDWTVGQVAARGRIGHLTYLLGAPAGGPASVCR